MHPEETPWSGFCTESWFRFLKGILNFVKAKVAFSVFSISVPFSFDALLALAIRAWSHQLTDQWGNQVESTKRSAPGYSFGTAKGGHQQPQLMDRFAFVPVLNYQISWAPGGVKLFISKKLAKTNAVGPLHWWQVMSMTIDNRTYWKQSRRCNEKVFKLPCTVYVCKYTYIPVQNRCITQCNQNSWVTMNHFYL